MNQMKIYSFDWATKKALTVYDGKKVKIIPNSIDEFQVFLADLGEEKAVMLFEFGGGDLFKIMAYRAGHAVMQVPGKRVKEYRDGKGEKKSDEADAKLLYDLFMNENGGSVTGKLGNPGPKMPSPDEKNDAGSAKKRFGNLEIRMPLCAAENTEEEGSAKRVVGNLVRPLPSSSSFYPFRESNASLAELKILFREHEDLKKEMVREKLKRIAFELRFRIAQVNDDRVKKILFHKSASIAAKEKELEQVKKILEKKVRQFPVWDSYLKGIKAVGPVIAAGLISEIGDKHFGSESSLKHYAGMIAKKGNHNFNRYLKMILYQFTEGIIKHRTPGWRELYDGMKKYYQEKHIDWSKGKVNNYAKKFVETRFLLEFWNKSRMRNITREIGNPKTKLFSCAEENKAGSAKGAVGNLSNRVPSRHKNQLEEKP